MNDEPITRTAQEWYEELDEPRGVVIYDASGFDQENWIYSWTMEPLTILDYYNKLSSCTLMMVNDIKDTNGK